MRGFFKRPLVIATLIACICGILRLADPFDHIYWNTRFRFGQVAAPQSIVLVTTDDSASGRPDDAARLLAILNSQAPKQIYFDQPLADVPEAPLSQQIRTLGDKITIVDRVANLETMTAGEARLPSRAMIGDARIAYSGWMIDFLNYAQAAPYTLRIGSRDVPSLAGELAGRSQTAPGYFIPDFSVDPASVLTVPASQLLRGNIAAGLLTGRSVIVTNAVKSDDAQIGYFGHGRVNPVVLDIAGAASIAANKSTRIGPLPMLVLFIAGIMAASRIPQRRSRWMAYALTSASILVGPAFLQVLGFICVPSPAILAALIFGGIRLWTKWRQRVQRTSASGLPNFVALAELCVPQSHNVVVAAIARYEEFLATLPANLHAECARQIARRFAVGSNTEQIFHGDNGHFAWIEPTLSPDMQVEHFEGLRALFSAPLRVGELMFDTNVHFGLDDNCSLDTQTRINTALASSNEALSAGRTIAQFEATRLANAPWELSLLARIDEGMKNGDIWVAYQPQWDYRENRIAGAEALVRWNDPVRGAIRPDAFIVQAERAGRIDALTYWVVEQAISAALAMNADVPHFQMSINLSALMVDKPSLLSSVAEIAQRRNIDCSQFTFEVTETATVRNRPAAVANLQQLRAMGFRLSIDDFGTGEASLLYLAELPSDELKIDQHFVARIQTGERERAIVASTIKLAHALRQSVVAEGIEDQATFDLLRKMGCDTGQGYFIARPGTFDQLRESTGICAKQSAKR